jgi:hypothetical protein
MIQPATLNEREAVGNKKKSAPTLTTAAAAVAAATVFLKENKYIYIYRHYNNMDY